jgi:carbon-monoxide dehydrogenase medium subunit
MHPASFDYYRPETIDETLDLLGEHEEARLLAGGHSLLPMMKLRLTSPGALIDIGRIEELTGIRKQGDRLVIGAMTIHAAVEHSEEVLRDCPILAETASHIGDLQVRNRGTIGGSLAHADPAGDLPTAILALEGLITVRGRRGEREIPAGEFFVDMFTTAVQPGELLTSVSVPVMGKRTGGAYEKHRHPASGYAVVGVAALVTLGNGRCSDARLAVGGLMGTPQRMTVAEEALEGEEPSEEAVAAAAEQVAEAIHDPMGDTYASGEYRTHLAGVLARRALTKAVERAR